MCYVGASAGATAVASAVPVAIVVVVAVAVVVVVAELVGVVVVVVVVEVEVVVVVVVVVFVSLPLNCRKSTALHKQKKQQSPTHMLQTSTQTRHVYERSKCDLNRTQHEGQHAFHGTRRVRGVMLSRTHTPLKERKEALKTCNN